jgi:hypothetical protein
MISSFRLSLPLFAYICLSVLTLFSDKALPAGYRATLPSHLSVSCAYPLSVFPPTSPSPALRLPRFPSLRVRTLQHT